MSLMTSQTRGAARPFLFLAAALLLLALLAALPGGRALAAPASTFVVTNTGDAAGACGAACSLRQAVAAANANPGEDTIIFFIPASDPNCSALNDCTITLGTYLPSFTDSDRTTIDGSGAQITISGGGNTGMAVTTASGVLTLRELTFTDGNSGPNSGGAIANNGTLDLINSTVRFSISQVSGGLYNGGDLFVSGSTFEGNKSGTDGGAIFSEIGLLTIVNSTFSGNIASDKGGAIYTDNAAISHSTFYANEATTGSILFDTNSAATIALANNLLAASPGSNCNSGAGGGYTDQGGNFSDDATCGTSGDNTNPLLSPTLQNNGGPTLTHDLLPGSPALNAAVLAFCPLEDQRGLPRPLGSGCESGALEDPIQVGPDFIVNSTLDTDDGACLFPGTGGNCTLREAVAAAQAAPGANTITFAIGATTPGCSAANVCTINLGAALPVFDDDSGATTIDGEAGDITLNGAGAVPFGSVLVDAELVLRYLTVINMKRSGAGGALRSDGKLTLERSAFLNNTSIGNGSVVYNEGVLHVIDSTFSGNDASTTAVLFSTNRLIVRGSTFSANIAGGGAAAITSSTGDLTIENSTFSGNAGTAAILAGGGFVSSSTFVNNSGADVIDTGLAVPPLALTNVLLSGADANCGTSGSGVILDGGGNISSNASCAFTAPSSLNSTNPQLNAALADNGGPTFTHALQNGSPAIDTAVSPACPPTDQRGVSRSIGGGCDRGAFESGAILVNVTEDSQDGTCSPLSSGDCTLREAIIVANSNPGPNDIFFYIPAADPGCSLTNVCTIPLANTLPAISDTFATVTINGPGGTVAVSGEDSVRILQTTAASALTLREMTLERGASATGSAITNGGLLTIRRSTLRANTATGTAGAILSNGGDLDISDSTFSGNSAPNGGAIFFASDPGKLEISNSTFSGNSATTSAGAIYTLSGEITNSTFYDNSAPTGGAVLELNASENLVLTNNLFVAGTAGGNCATVNGVISDGGGNFSDDASCGTSGDNATILLDAGLADNGGATRTHALRLGSDGIDGALVGSCPDNDQRGLPRPLGSNCDSGAFEITYFAEVSGQVTLQGRSAPGTPGTVTFVYDNDVYPPVEVPFDLADGSYSTPLPVLLGGSFAGVTAAHSLYLDNERIPAPFSPGSVALPATQLKGGDANNNGVINILDLACMGGAYNTPGATCGGTGGTDINLDGITNISDLAIAGGNYNDTSPRPW